MANRAAQLERGPGRVPKWINHDAFDKSLAKHMEELGKNPEDPSELDIKEIADRFHDEMRVLDSRREFLKHYLLYLHDKMMASYREQRAALED